MGYKLQKSGEQIDAILLKAVLSIADVYPSVASLTTAFPSGNSNIYRVGDKWYFWKSNAWVEGGTFNKDTSFKYSPENITVVDGIGDASGAPDWPTYPNGHIFFCLQNNRYFVKTSDSGGGFTAAGAFHSGVLADGYVLLKLDQSTIPANSLYAGFGNRVVIMPKDGYDYLVVANSATSITALRINGLVSYKADNIPSGTYVSQYLGNSTYEHNLALTDNVVKFQSTMALIQSPTKNINGREFVHYTAVETTIGGYEVYQIKKDGNNCSESDAAEYLEYMNGSVYVPKYNYDKPKSSYFLMTDGTVLKPQFDSTNGLVLYKMDAIALKKDLDQLKDDLEKGRFIPAKALLSDNFDSKLSLTDVKAFNFRTTAGGEEVGTPCKVKRIIGGSLGSNQLADESLYQTGPFDGLTPTLNNHVYKVTGTTTQGTNIGLTHAWDLPAGHVFLLSGFTKHKGMNLLAYNEYDVAWLLSEDNPATEVICKIDRTYGRQGFYVYFNVGYAGSEVDIECTPQIFDLTTMLGAIIANYINSLEQATPGAGVAWFKRYFKKKYYPYKAVGTFEHVKTKGKKYTWFNQFNINDASQIFTNDFNYDNGEASNKVVDSRDKMELSILAVENDGSSWVWYIALVYRILTVLGKQIALFTTPYEHPFNEVVIKHNGSQRDIQLCKLENLMAGTTYCLSFDLVSNDPTTVGGLRIKDINVNYHWDGERDGEYEEYKSQTHATDPIDLIGVPKIDEQGNLYFEGNSYNADGSIDEEWEEHEITLDDDYVAYGSYVDGMRVRIKFANNGYFDGNTLGLSNRLPFLSNGDAYGTYGGMVVSRNDDENGIFFYSTKSDGAEAIAEAKDVLVGTSVVLKKKVATQGTSVTPFAEAQECDNWGTEEWLAPDNDTRIFEIPTGHETEYLPDLKAKLESAPGNPENDGDYVMHREDGENSYTPLAAWLADNGYKQSIDKADDSHIVTSQGLTLVLRSVTTIGDVNVMTLRIKNETGNTIAADTQICALSSDLTFLGQLTMYFPAIIEQSNDVIKHVCAYIDSVTNSLKLRDAMNHGDQLFLSIAYSK